MRIDSALEIMSRHLKNIIQNRLERVVSYYAPYSEIAASHRRGVRYIMPVTAINIFWGKMDMVKEGRHYRKHIVVRRVPRNGGQLLQLYTYHFPKHWSAACVANRELIKEAQRQAHALERDHSLAALEWRTRFLHHYFRVFKGGEKPEPGMKAYSRFYQYTYVALYRELKAAQQKTEETDINVDAVTFEPIVPEKLFRPHRHKERNILDLAFAPRNELVFPPPDTENYK